MKVLFRFLKRAGLGHIPGLLALYNFLYGFFIHFCKINPIVHIDGQKILISKDDLSTSRRLLVYGEYVQETTEFLKGAIREGMVVADIGANIGYYTLLAAKRVGTSGRVYAFEPDPRCVEILRKNILLNGHSNVVVMPNAVSSAGGGQFQFIWVRIIFRLLP